MRQILILTLTLTPTLTRLTAHYHILRHPDNRPAPRASVRIGHRHRNCFAMRGQTHSLVICRHVVSVLAFHTVPCSRRSCLG